ncbi:MAG: translation elongation factor Ts [Candidatus Coatesbacteria bacterium]|nr:translation elongation factor Ts [Candidatus Coatesbacteria bacterium]
MAVEIPAKQVMALRKKTGAGIVDCKKALQETGGDEEKAVEFLRVKGLAKAAKKSGREAGEGIVHSYIHAGDKLGVLLELRCETDFVARTDDFKALANNLCLQIAAMAPVAVDESEFPEEVLEQERRVLREQALESGKPEKIVDKMVEGRIGKFLKEKTLLEQIYVRNQPENKDRTVRDFIKENIAKLGENIEVARFTRYELGR